MNYLVDYIKKHYNFAIFASCLQDVGKGREQERKLWRELFFMDGNYPDHISHADSGSP